MSQVDFIPTPKFAEYQERFKHHYKLDRRADGVILAQAHTNGGHPSGPAAAQIRRE